MSAQHAGRGAADDDEKHTTRGPAAILERMTLAEWDRLLDGEVSAADLREKYLGDAGTDQLQLEEWSA